MRRDMTWPTEFRRWSTLPTVRAEIVPVVTWSRWGHGEPEGRALHCFVDDWRLEVTWRRPERGLIRALAAAAVTAPDFSIPWNAPQELAEWQAFRSGLVARYWRAHGADVYPVLMWGEHRPRVWAAEGSVVAVRGPSAGTLPRWLHGAKWYAERIQPRAVLTFGRIEGAEVWGCDVIQVGTHGGIGDRWERGNLPARTGCSKRGSGVA